MILDSFYGNEPIKRTLSLAIKNNTLPHAVLIEGEAGLGAGFLSELLAASVLCEHGGCGECRSCRKFQKGIHPDIITLDKANSMISVDDIRALGATARIYPNDCDKKVYVIQNAQNMNQKAQNALLKLLEEPPSFVTFILSVDKKDKLLDTVLSRCVFLKVEPVKQSVVKAYLTAEAKLKPAEAEHTAMLSYGFIGRARSLLEKRTAKRDLQKRELCLDMLETLCFKDEFSFLTLQKRLTDERDKSKDEKEGAGVIFDTIARLLSDILHMSVGKACVTFTDDEEKLASLSKHLSTSELALLYDAAEDTRGQILRNVNYSACINSFLVRAWEVVHG